MSAPAAAVALVALLAPLSIGLSSRGPASDTRSPNVQDLDEDRIEAEVQAFLEHYLRALESRDEDAIESLFVRDDRLAWFTDGALAYSKPGEILAALRGFGDATFRTELSDVRVVPLSAVHASASSSFVTRLEFPEADDHEFGGIITWLFERDLESGAWRVLLGHTSTPGGPPKREDR